MSFMSYINLYPLMHMWFYMVCSIEVKMYQIYHLLNAAILRYNPLYQEPESG